MLFDLARHHAPSTIFLDEIDALMGARGAEGEHEASRRMKTEILIQIDGLSRSSRRASSSEEPEPQVFVLCATNLPWELDMVSRVWFQMLLQLALAYTGHQSCPQDCNCRPAGIDVNSADLQVNRTCSS